MKVVSVPVTEIQPAAEITGEVRARFQADLAFRTDGRVIERLADVGSVVHKGELLARLDATEKRADVSIARAELRAAQSTLKLKKNIFARNQKLRSSGAISQADWDNSREELTSAESSVAVARASLDTALDSLSFTELRADADGVITSRSIEVGQVVSSAQTAFTLAQDGHRDAVFQVFEAYFLNGQPLKNIDVSRVADRTHNIQATLREIAPVLTEGAGTVRVKATLPENLSWPLGTPVVGNFRSPSREGSILPASAITSRRGHPAVWVVDAQKKTVSLRQVSVSRYRTDDFIVTQGVKPQELIVSEGGKFLSEGQAVRWEVN
ncbi:efflux RND transporter periplasmic adaptor subunit [Pectobacterium sp. B2J-2]|uniref:efflux RND transporter periplasmic adaptor subunit n=1 Tax=Pectobacterium sp. B2J-2 TaxID=3385372 RepID=UPI0038FCE483